MSVQLSSDGAIEGQCYGAVGCAVFVVIKVNAELRSQQNIQKLAE
jgi:hypothetical protein